jgi:hypothetical protein
LTQNREIDLIPYATTRVPVAVPCQCWLKELVATLLSASLSLKNMN